MISRFPTHEIPANIFVEKLYKKEPPPPKCDCLLKRPTIFSCFPGENAHSSDRHRERFLFSGRPDRYRVVRRAVPRTRLLRRVHHSHGAVHIRLRVRHGVHQRDQTGSEHREQRAAAEEHVLRGFHPRLFQPEPHQGSRPRHVQRRTAQQKAEDYFFDGGRHRRDGSYARFVSHKNRRYA